MARKPHSRGAGGAFTTLEGLYEEAPLVLEARLDREAGVARQRSIPPRRVGYRPPLRDVARQSVVAAPPGPARATAARVEVVRALERGDELDARGLMRSIEARAGRGDAIGAVVAAPLQPGPAAAQGTDVFYLVRAEVRFLIFASLQGAVFADLGNRWIDVF